MNKILTFLFSLVFLGQAMAQPGAHETFHCPQGSFLDTNLVFNGDFSAGNAGFTTTYTYCNSSNCLFTLINNGYSIGPNANYFHIDFSGVDHTTGTGNFMLINGQDSTLIPWSQTVAVQPGSTYVFSLWMSSMDTLPYPGSAVIKVLINGVSITGITAPDSLNRWIEFTAPWNSGTNTSAVITIKDSISDWNGFDYGLDDISLRKCIDTTAAVDTTTVIDTTTTAVVQNTIAKKIIIRPNPSNGHFYVINSPAGSQIAVYNALGMKVLLSGNLNPLTPAEIDISDQPAGVYLLRVISAGAQILNSEKVIIER